MTPDGRERSTPPALLSSVRAFAGRLAAGAVRAVVTVVVLVFVAATVVGRAKEVLGCAGLTGKRATETPKIALRELDLSRPEDARFASSLTRMAGVAGIPQANIRTKIVVTDVVNAAAFDESSFLLFEGLQRVPDGALDAIMAHEAAHAALHHARARSRMSKIVSGVTQLVGLVVGADSSGRHEAADWATGVAVPSYSRQQELEADAVAVELLDKGGYAGDGAAVMQRTLQMLEADFGPSGGGFLDNHPALGERVQRLRARLGSGPVPAEVLAEQARKITSSVVPKARSGEKANLGSESLLYLTDSDLVSLTRLRLRMVTASSEPVCAGFMTSDGSTLPAAMNHLTPAEMDEFLRITRSGLEAFTKGGPRRVVSQEKVKAAWRQITEMLPPESASRLRELSKVQGRPPRADLCWGARTLYGGITTLPDREAAAHLSLRMAGF